MPAEATVYKLERSLYAKGSELVGCQRQNRIRGEDNSWRFIRGNALCAHLGYKIRASTPIDDFDVFFRQDEELGDIIVTFRGGSWKPWWDEDIQLLGALSKLYVCQTLSSVLVLHELDSSIQGVVRPVGDLDECSKLVQAALDKWRDMGRIRKDSPRAQALCQFCPVWRECNRLDLERGDIHDWNRRPHYTVG